jgi:hypothetical protein
MEKLLAIQTPGFDAVGAPEGVPTGGLDAGSNILQWGVSFAIVAAVVIALFMLVYSGLQYIQSGGDKQKIEAARHRIVFTIVGLIVVFISFAIINVIGTVFGVKLLGGFSSQQGNHTIDKKAKTDRVPQYPRQQRTGF